MEAAKPRWQRLGDEHDAGGIGGPRPPSGLGSVPQEEARQAAAAVPVDRFIDRRLDARCARHKDDLGEAFRPTHVTTEGKP